MTAYILPFILGLLLASLIAWLLFRSIIKQKNAALTERLQTQATLISQAITEKQELQKEKEELLEKNARTESKLGFLEEKLATQKEELNTMGEAFKLQFRDLAQNILDEKTQKFTEVNEQKMKAILDPLKTDLGNFKQKVVETYDRESKERFSLGKEVERLITMTQQVSQEANNLTTALKGNNKMQGNWGEMILESLLENSGLTRDREYFIQQFIRDNAGNIIKDENGNGLQPDVTICYPDQRKIILDSKVSLLAWDECMAQDTKEEQQRCLLQHIKSIRTHIDGLSRKNYPRYALALDYVLLFIPIEPAFLEAVKTDVTLWKYAYDKKILLVSPTNLFAVLKIISDLWKVEQQNKNAIDIADKAGSLYDKFALFVENFLQVGKKITEANESYDTALKQISTGRGNVVGKIEELKKMGANAGKQLPDKILDLGD
jgi:DNA recombination protein RmuC